MANGEDSLVPKHDAERDKKRRRRPGMSGRGLRDQYIREAVRLVVKINREAFEELKDK